MARRADPAKLKKASARLGDAALDPDLWPEILAEICEAAAATGALLLQTDRRTPDVPRTASIDELVKYYFQNNWHTQDIRAERAVPLLLTGTRAFIDEDILTRDEFGSLAFINECTMPRGYKWAAGVGFSAGSALWGLCLHRRINEAPFDRRDASLLSALSRRLTEVATLSTAVGRMALTSTISALDRLSRPAIAINQLGRVVGINLMAQRLLGNDIRVFQGRIALKDQ